MPSYEAALAAGGTTNGPPGVHEHYHPTCYAAFVHDPDGHNVEAVYRSAETRSRWDWLGAGVVAAIDELLSAGPASSRLETWSSRRRGNTEGTPLRARASTAGHPSSGDSFFLCGFRARVFPDVPALPASLLDGKEGSTVRVRQRGSNKDLQRGLLPSRPSISRSIRAVWGQILLSRLRARRRSPRARSPRSTRRRSG